MAEKKAEAGEIIFNEGDVADVAYVVLSGSVELTYTGNAGEVKAGVVEEGRVLGELAIFNPQELRPYTARTFTPVALQSVSQKEFQSMFAKCPEEIQPFLIMAFEKITPVRTKAKAPVSKLSKNDVGKVVIAPASDNLKAQFKPVEIAVSSLPFRIGGYPENGEKNRKDQVHLSIASQKNPLVVSRQHCEITLDDKDNLVVHDLGSRFCTTVNGLMIGRGRGIYTAPLQKGDNEVYLGTGEIKYKLSVKCG